MSREMGRELLLHMFGRPKGLLGRDDSAESSWRASIDRPQRKPSSCSMFGQTTRCWRSAPDPGGGVQLLLECVTGGWVAGVDQSQEMVGQAAARNAAALRERTVDLRYGSVERLPFTEDAFDKALAINSMQVHPMPVSAAGDTARSRTK